MIEAPLPLNERQRLATLRSLKILDTPPEERFDRITRLARRVFNVPIATVTLIDSDRHWCKSWQGLEHREGPRNISFCAHTILNEQPMVVGDAFNDERFCDNPLVTGEPNIRFYAGYPLSAPDGSRLGTLCIIDRQPRTITDEDLGTLTTLGRMIESELVAMNLATSDTITGISNLRGFLEIGRYLQSITLRFNLMLRLLVLKIPQIETFYQQRGVAEAERVLVEVSQILLSSFRESDLVARIGTDEFGVLLVGQEPAHDDPTLRRIEELLQNLNLQRSEKMQVTAKLAAVTFDAKRHANLEGLIVAAEAHLA